MDTNVKYKLSTANLASIPNATLDCPDPEIRLRDIKFYVVPANKFSKWLLRFIQLYIKIVWSEEHLEVNREVGEGLVEGKIATKCDSTGID